MKVYSQTKNIFLLCAAVLIFGAGQFIEAQTPSPTKYISREEAVRLSLLQASNFQQARLNEQIAEQDVFLANKAFLPKVSANPTVILTSPTLGRITAGTPRSPSFWAQMRLPNIRDW